MNKSHSGSTHPNWKGGKRITTQGYVEVYCPNHPFATVRGCVLEHRLVMESKLGRYLKKGEVVHHVNHTKTDNRPENLQLIPSSSEHMSMHSKGEANPMYGKRVTEEAKRKMSLKWKAYKDTDGFKEFQQRQTAASSERATKFTRDEGGRFARLSV